MHYDAAASKAMGIFPSPSRFRLATALGHGNGSNEASDFSLLSILDTTCTAMGTRELKGYVGKVISMMVFGCTNDESEIFRGRYTLHPYVVVPGATNIPGVPSMLLLATFELLRFRWLQHPLLDMEEINRRQIMIETICSNSVLMNSLQKGSGMLRGMPGMVSAGRRELSCHMLRVLVPFTHALVELFCDGSHDSTCFGGSAVLCLHGKLDIAEASVGSHLSTSMRLRNDCLVSFCTIKCVVCLKAPEWPISPSTSKYFCSVIPRGKEYLPVNSPVFCTSVDLDKFAQQFLRKPARANLATLLGIYRAVMRLTSVAHALDEAIKDDRAEMDEAQATETGAENEEAGKSCQARRDEECLGGRELFSKRIILPLHKVQDTGYRIHRESRNRARVCVCIQ